MLREGNSIGMVEVLGIKAIRQEGCDYCAQACIHTLVKYKYPNKNYSQSGHYEEVGDRSWGTSHSELLELAGQYFKDYRGQSGWDVKDVIRMLNNGYVFIINWWDDCIYSDDDPADGHYAILAGVDLITDRALIVDPSDKKRFDFNGEEYQISGMSTVPLSWLLERWYDFDKEGNRIDRWSVAVNLK